MRDSHKRAQEYKVSLPKIKEKLFATALLFAVSCFMLTTVSFAWLSLSVNPELKGLTTGIAANGNLEIALATGTMNNYFAPGESAAGDANLSLLQKNLTWGNLINLSDPQYGLKNMVLRPAILNDTNLASSPLKAPLYDADGRRNGWNTSFGFASWNQYENKFVASQELGVRALASLKAQVSEDNREKMQFLQKLSAVESQNLDLQEKYQSIANTQKYMDALASMMTGYMVENILRPKGSNTVTGMLPDTMYLNYSDLVEFSNMYEEAIACFEQEADIVAQLLNLQMEVRGQSRRITGTQLLFEYGTPNATQETIKKNLLDIGFLTDSSAKTAINQIDQFVADYHTMVADKALIDQMAAQIQPLSGSRVNWLESPKEEGGTARIIDQVINRLVVVGESTISAKGTGKPQPISSLVGGSVLLPLISGTHETKITKGILKRFDEYTGARLKTPEGNPMVLTVGSQSIKSNVSTDATDNFLANEVAYLRTTINNIEGEVIMAAQDSYGFAVDFWVRTNAKNSYLTLQGNVLTQTEEVLVKGKDLNGKEVQLYTISIKEENQETDPNDPMAGLIATTYDVYKSTQIDEQTQQEVECWRFADNHMVVTAEGLKVSSIPTPITKIELREVVIGFEGDNRVWTGDDHALLSVNSTTQGSGSCYVFYAETPVDQARSLELLRAMKVAFVDAQGTLLANAFMDVDHAYISAGKVIVPLALDTECLNIGTEENPLRAITALEQNVATLITALVYLDGESVTNDKVLAAADIEGQMNIQFGSSAALNAMGNEKLYDSELYATAQLTNTSFTYGQAAEMTTHVKVTVTGSQPTTVTARFVRRINTTQGSQEEIFRLYDDDKDGVWEGDYTFLYPGTYILRSVQIDGTDKELIVEQGQSFPTVIVDGFALRSVEYNLDSLVMTDAGYYSGTVIANFMSNDPAKMPKQLQGKFVRADGAAADVNFTYNATQGNWQGNVRFTSSGLYVMEYMLMDGQYVYLDENMQHSIELTLGLRAHVITYSPTYMLTTEAPDILQMQVQILDNNGNPLSYLAGASLTYAMGTTNTLYTPLQWNEKARCYTGEFYPQAGTYYFAYVTVKMGDIVNTLVTVNSDAPVFTIVPPTPPSFVSVSADQGSAVFIKTSSAQSNTVRISLQDADSATVVGKFVQYNVNGSATGNVKYLVATFSDTDTRAANMFHYTFNNVPSGLWQLESVSVFNMFGKDDRLHPMPEDGVVDTETEYREGILFDTASEPNFVQQQVAVLYQSDVKVTLDYTDAGFESTTNGVGYFGKVGNEITGTFMETYTIPTGGITATFYDEYGLLGSSYFSVTNITLPYTYSDDSGKDTTKYGGYTTTDETVKGGAAFKTLVFQPTDNGGVFTLSEDLVLQYAAGYVPGKVTYTVVPAGDEDPSDNGAATSDVLDAVSFEVYSKVSVYISTISPNGKHTSLNSNGETSVESKKENDYSATVYCQEIKNGSRATIQQYPSVTLQINGKGSATATMQFSDGNIQMYSSWSGGASKSGQTNQYSWAANENTCTRYFGDYTEGGCSSVRRNGAGRLECQKLTLTYNGQTYTFALPTAIVINNPSL